MDIQVLRTIELALTYILMVCFNLSQNNLSYRTEQSFNGIDQMSQVSVLQLLASRKGGILLMNTGILVLFQQILLHVVGTDTFDLCPHLLLLVAMPDDRV